MHFSSRHLEPKIDKHCAKAYIMWSMIAWQHFLHKASIRTVPSREIVPRAHHSEMQKDGWAKYIQNFAFK